jgi:hypothetical protein
LNAGFQPMGGSLHTKYDRQLLPISVEITRRHHPLAGQKFAPVRSGKDYFVLLLPDTSHIKIPKNWTNFGSNLEIDPMCQDTVFTKASVLELLDIVGILSLR